MRSEDGWRCSRDITPYLLDFQNHGFLGRHRVMAENQPVTSQQLTLTHRLIFIVKVHTLLSSQLRSVHCAIKSSEFPRQNRCHFSTYAGLPLGTTDRVLPPKVRCQFAAGYTSYKFRSYNRSVREITTRNICQPAPHNLQKPKLTQWNRL